MLKLTILTLLLTASAAAAQNQAAPQSDVVGPPALQDFDLGGEKVTPSLPRPAQTTQNAQPPVVSVTPPPAAVAPPTRTESRAAPTRSAPAARRNDATPATPSAPADTAAAAPEPAISVPANASSTVSNATPATPPEQIAPEQQEEGGSGFPIWLAIAAGAILVGAGFVLGRGRARNAAPAVAEPAPEPAPAARASASMPVRPLTPVPDAPRAAIELTFQPTTTVLGEKEAVVHFLLSVHNSGAVPARNVRLEARVFNASGGVDADIGQFFAAPLQRRVVPLPEAIPAGERFGIEGQVPIEAADISPIEIDGRRLFIPIVAVTAIYEWAGGSGQTSKSYMVGVEANQTGKMGPFRLDQGPRVYRSVGQRAHRLVKIA
ncbi:MAG TPA: hypothetical protein VI381_07975 [Allosphingosinicella sp.]